MFLYWLAGAIIWLANSFFILPVGGWLDDLCPLFASEHERFGINATRLYGKDITDYDAARTNAAWYLDYTPRMAPPSPGGMTFLQILGARSFHPQDRPVNVEEINKLVDANLGAIWILGNEPDRPEFQDSQPPDHYAIFYHDAYMAIKSRDPTSLVAIAGIVQPTPIRLRYLDQVLDAYRARYDRALPVDIWTFHNFILRESLTGWGAGIPSGLEAFAHEGKLFGVDDHGRIDLFQAQVVTMRRWLADHGYRNKPLFLTEYGILLPDVYDYTEAVVRDYMTATFDYLRTATDPSTGYPQDGNRLVQSWGWFSLNDKRYDIQTSKGFNGNLFDHDSGAITMLGEAYEAYTAPLVDAYADPAIAALRVLPSLAVSPTVPHTLTLEVDLANGGTLSADDVTLQVWNGSPSSGELIDTSVVPNLARRCGSIVTISTVWSDMQFPPGFTQITATIASAADRNSANNRAVAVVIALQPGDILHTDYMPVLSRQRGIE